LDWVQKDYVKTVALKPNTGATAMTNKILILLAATLTIASFTSAMQANAEIIRDHRKPTRIAPPPAAPMNQETAQLSNCKKIIRQAAGRAAATFFSDSGYKKFYYHYNLADNAFRNHQVGKCYNHAILAMEMVK
jgi:hypothetical protein